jgi:antirestriction protein ArdC
MDAKSYCDTVTHELTAWKAKIYDVIRKSERLNTQGKRKAEPLIKELNSALDDLNTKIELLSRECPADFGSQRRKIKETMTQVKGSWKKVWGVLGEKEYGIGGA